MSDLTIIIPVYNEDKNIKAVLEKIESEVKYPHVIKIIYDFEQDTTIPVVEQERLNYTTQIELIKNKYGRGALNAIKTGLSEVTTEFAVVTMADLCDPPVIINTMYKKALDESADIVCASRYMKGGSQSGGGLIKPLMSKYACLSLWFLTGIPTHDATNSFKLYRKFFLDSVQIESNGGFELGLELVVKAYLSGYKIAEVPTSWVDRIAGKSNFKLIEWLPSYLKWYLKAFTKMNKRGNYAK